MACSSHSLELRAVSHTHQGAPVLCDLTLAFAPATFNVLVGEAEGAAIVRIAGLRELPEVGDVLIDGQSTRALDDAARMDLRSRRFGYLFAAPYLLPAMAVLENVAMPLFKLTSTGVEEARERTEAMLDFVGLAGCEHLNAGAFTHFQQQRVALARALILQPSFLVVEHADAGTAPEETACFLELLRAVPKQFGTTVIAALVAPFTAVKDDRVVSMQGGSVYGDSLRLPAGGSSPS